MIAMARLALLARSFCKHSRSFTSMSAAVPGAGSCLCRVTTPVDAAEDIANILVTEKLAACVNITPSVKSVYLWDGKVQQDEEAVLMIKTMQHLQPQLIARLKHVHPYDVPAIVFLPISSTSAECLEWLQDSALPAVADE